MSARAARAASKSIAKSTALDSNLSADQTTPCRRRSSGRRAHRASSRRRPAWRNAPSGSSRCFLARLAKLGALICVLLAPERWVSSSPRTRRPGLPSSGRSTRSRPSARFLSPDDGRAGAQGSADRARRRYALLRARGGDRVLRRRPRHRPSRRAQEAESGRHAHRSLPGLRLRPGGATGRTRPARGGCELRRHRPNPESLEGPRRRDSLPRGRGLGRSASPQAGIERAER